MARRVYLHVGTPKSGTSYLQDKLALNRDELERQGLDYVRTRTGDHFEPALDLIGEKWAGEDPFDARGTIYWSPNIITDKNGKASLEYYNADTKGTYRVVVEGIDDEGRIGRTVYRYTVK